MSYQTLERSMGLLTLKKKENAQLLLLVITFLELPRAGSKNCNALRKSQLFIRSDGRKYLRKKVIKELVK